MLIYQTLRVVSLLVFIALLVLALLRPRTRQPVIVAGLVLSILATIPSLPGVSTALFRAFWHYDPQNRHLGYYAYVDLVNLALVVGAGLFGWGALTSSPRTAPAPAWGAQQPAMGWQARPWEQPQQQWQQDPARQYPANQYPAHQYPANPSPANPSPAASFPQQYPAGQPQQPWGGQSPNSSNQLNPSQAGASDQASPSNQADPSNQQWSGQDWQRRP